MSLSLSQQADLAIQGITFGDIDLLSRLLTSPNSVTIEDQKTAAQRLGFKDRFLSAITNVAADPTVWLAFAMSRRFPSNAWLEGRVPSRFVGAANEFSGISMFTRPVQEWFRGTTVPKMVSLAMHRETEVMQLAHDKIFKPLTSRTNWRDEMPQVSMILEGQPVSADPALFDVARKIRGGMEDLWSMLAKTKQISGGFDGTEITKAAARDWMPENAPKYLRDYLPHIPLHTNETLMTTTAKDALDRLGMGRVAQTFGAFGVDPKQVWTVDSAGRLASDFSRYQAMLNNVQGQVWNQHLFQRQRFNVPLQSQLGQELFVTDLNLVLQKYVRSVAKTYALNAPITDYERALTATKTAMPDGSYKTAMANNDPLMVQIINEGLNATGHQFQAYQIPGTQHVVDRMVPNSGNALSVTALRDLVKGVRGQLDEGEIIWGNLFAAAGQTWDQTVGRAQGKTYSEVDRAMRAMRRNADWRKMSNGITSYFYSTTLGLNPWAAMQNLLQPFMTTGPAIGLGHTLAGMSEMGGRMRQYASEFASEYRSIKFGETSNWFEKMNEAAQRSFNRAFPELAASGIKPDPRLFDVNPGSVAEKQGRWGGIFKTYDDFARFITQPFTHAEMANQASAFYGARRAIKSAMSSGQYEIPMKPIGPDRYAPLSPAELEGAINFDAGNIVNATQFRPGPGGRTIWQGRLPSFVRMFTTFPTRMLSFFGESTVRGAMTDKELETAGLLSKVTGGRNLGTLARTYLYSNLAIKGMRDVLGVDLSGSMGLTSPLTVGPQGNTLAPFALSPVASTALGIISAATNRDIKQMQPMQIPGYGDIPVPRTLIPGGVATSRVIRALRQYRPDVGGFVDDDERMMYRGNSSDLIMSMMGVPLDKGRRLRNDLERAESNRQYMKDMRRRFAAANSNYDTAGMAAVSQEWAKAFPKNPPLSVEDRDVDRYHEAARTPVVQRLLATMGEQGEYLHQQIYEVDPDLVLPPSDAYGQQ